MEETRSLYDRDFALWTAEQAEAIRAAASSGANLPLDWENLAEEVESLGRSQRTELQNRLATIIEHLLKLRFSPALEPRRRWMETVDRARDEAEVLLDTNPSLRPFVDDAIGMALSHGARRAIASLDHHGELMADGRARIEQARFTSPEVLGAWWPHDSAGEGG